MTFNPANWPLKRDAERLGDAIIAAFDRAESRLTAATPNAVKALVGGGRRDVLTPQERAGIATFSNSDAFSDRSRTFSFRATDARGREGLFTTSVNQLLIIEPSYDAAKTALRRLLTMLEERRIITRERPTAPPNVSRFQSLGYSGGWGDGATSYAYNGIGDPRCLTGQWADWPRYGGLKPRHDYNMSPTAIGYDQFSSGPFLPGLPLPNQWTRYYPLENLWNRQAFSDEDFVALLGELTTQIVLLVKGANANPEWHPSLVFFLNGVYPHVHTAGVWNGVDSRYQYKELHPWCRLTEGSDMAFTGLTPVGRNDALWMHSMRCRAPRAYEEHHEPLIGNDWAKQEYADAIGSFMQLVNLASHVVDLGASAHVHGALEHHAAVSQKAYEELGLTAGAGLSGYLAGLARERQAREARAQQSAGAAGAGLQLVGGTAWSPDREIANQILNGATVASAQLFMVSPLAGGIAVAVVALGVLLVNLFMPPQVECNGSMIRVRDGRRRVRDVDIENCPGAHGDTWNGNLLPHTRANAINGRPAVRVKDSFGRDVA